MLFVLVSIILSSLAVLAAAHILPGIQVSNYSIALIVAIVLGFINTFIRPFLLILTLPINVLTLGLFTLVIMALCVMLASAIVPGFYVASFWWAMAFALIFAIFNAFLGGF